MPQVSTAADGNVLTDFYNSILSNSDSMALNEFWLVKIGNDDMRDIFLIIQEKIKLWENDKWDIQGLTDELLIAKNWIGNYYYLLARGIEFPGDQLTGERVGTSQNGMMNGVIITDRTPLNTVNMSFIETNNSFVDGMIRPWMIMVGHKSLKDFKLRKDIELTSLQKSTNMGFVKRKVIILKDAAPVSVDMQEQNYQTTGAINRQVTFTYSTYSLQMYHPVLVDPDMGKYAKSKMTPNPPNFIPPSEASDAARLKGIMRKLDPVYNDVKSLIKPPETNILQSIKDGISIARSAVNQVQGIANAVQQQTVTALTLIGQEGLADKANAAFNSFRSNVTNPVGNVLDTGSRGTQAADAVLNIGNVLSNALPAQGQVDAANSFMNNNLNNINRPPTQLEVGPPSSLFTENQNSLSLKQGG